MPAIPLGLNAYNRAAGRLPAVRCVNQYVEPTSVESDGTVLLPRPALAAFATVGDGPIRGLYRQAGTFGGDFLVVSGAELYRVTSAGVATLLGSVPGVARVTIASSGVYAVIATGEGAYSTDGLTVAPIAFPDGAGVTSVDYMNSYFLFSRAGSQAFYWSAVAGITVDALDYASAESTADNLVGLRVIGDELWLFGETTTEVWIPTGNADLAFQRVTGRISPRGCIGRDTIAKLDNTLFFVGNDRIVYRAGDVPQRISTHSIEETLRKGTASDFRAWSFSFDGHTLYVLTAGDLGTFCYDLASQQWCEFKSYGRSSWRAHLGAYNSDFTLCGDDESGALYKLDNDVYLDASDPIERTVTAGVEVSSGRPPNNNFSLQVATGTAAVDVSDHVVELRQSDDLGNTWGNWQSRDLGAIGEHGKRVIWRRRGLMRPPGRVFEIRITSPVAYRLSGATINDEFPG